jgi:hypothetical protein
MLPDTTEFPLGNPDRSARRLVWFSKGLPCFVSTCLSNSLYYCRTMGLILTLLHHHAIALDGDIWSASPSGHCTARWLMDRDLELSSQFLCTDKDWNAAPNPPAWPVTCYYLLFDAVHLARSVTSHLQTTGRDVSEYLKCAWHVTVWPAAAIPSKT